jgi:hypothetical protein
MDSQSLNDTQTGVNRRAIAPTLRAMAIDGTEIFPGEQWCSLCNARVRLQKTKRMDFSFRTVEGSIVVTRIQ